MADFTLTTTTINRLLRPLRNRCVAFAKFQSPPPPLRTYSTRDPIHFDVPPLSILHPPDKLGIRIHFDKHVLDVLDLSRKIYAVRDSFRDILFKMPNTSPAPTAFPTSASLVAICSIVVGQNLDCNADEANDIYEVVPMQYRGWTLVSHAVEIVLASCPHHPTLLRILLDLCLSHRLAHNAQALLQALLFCAVRPTPVIPPLCHPLHSSFLLDIEGQWTCAGFSKYQFTVILLTALGTVTSADAWASKAVEAFGKAASKTHFRSFLDLAIALVDFISRQVQVCDQQKEDMPKVEGLLRSLCGWVNVLSESYFSLDGVNVALEDCHSLSELISVICSLLISTQALGISTSNLSTSVLKISTQWQVFFPKAAHTGRVVQSLRRLVPETTAYSHLIHSVYSSGNLRDCHKMLHTYASALRSNGLLRLEASLWACALRHLERPGPDDIISNINPAHLEDYRQRLIHIVDEAESRCFGGPNPSLAMGSQSLPLNPIQPEEGKLESLTPVTVLNCHWEWESAIGCWMRKCDTRSPPKKRRRMAVDVSCTVKEVRSSVNHKRFVSPPLESPSHNFSSLLADAFTKRANLHQKPTRRDSIRTSTVLTNDKHRPPSCPALSRQDHLPSDDAMDLFTYPQSSPSR